MDQNYWLILIYWTIYFSFHSFLAAGKVKKFAYAQIGLSPKTYRLGYSLLSLVGLVVFLWWYAGLAHHYLFPKNVYTQLPGLFLSTWSILLFKRAFKAYSLKGFVGLEEEDKPLLVTSGMQSKIRHPLYTATIMLISGLLLFMPSIENLLTWLCFITYIPIGIYFEEQKLIAVFGTEYSQYRDAVPMLFPKLF